jgi:hypothetical protein
MNATLDSDGNSVSFGQKISYCLNNKSVPFLNLCRRSSGFEIEVAITPNIRAELRKNDRSTSVMTMNALASKIPGFEYELRNVDGRRVRVICGPMDTGFMGIYPDFLFMMSMDKERCWRMMKVFLASGGNSMTRIITSYFYRGIISVYLNIFLSYFEYHFNFLINYVFTTGYGKDNKTPFLSCALL